MLQMFTGLQNYVKMSLCQRNPSLRSFLPMICPFILTLFYFLVFQPSANQLIIIWIFLSLDEPFHSVQFLSSVQHFVTPWTAARQASLSIINSQSLHKLMSIASVMPSNHLIRCHPLQSSPASESFPVSQFFTSGGQSIGASASASVLPMNIQDWFPLGWTGWISLQSGGLSRVFSKSTVQKHQFFSTQLSL